MKSRFVSERPYGKEQKGRKMCQRHERSAKAERIEPYLTLDETIISNDEKVHPLTAICSLTPYFASRPLLMVHAPF